ncbi:MAG: peptidylprolyl isomerase [Planctomycetota bacterium]|nr:peptidylprolyl isomerase [Planctomycetota bacterium]
MAATRTTSSSHARRLAGAALIWLATASSGVAASGDDWTAIRGSYDQLRNYMSAKKVIGSDERASLVELQGRLDAYRAENPEDPKPLAMDIQVATWLGDDARVDADYEARLKLTDLDRVQVAFARHRLGQNRYGSIPAILATGSVDLEAEPEAGLLVARSHMARNRFQEAIDAIDAIPEEGLGKPGIRARANRTRAEAARWLTLWQDELALRETEEAAGTAPVMQLITSRGPVTILLYEDQAPNTVANFIELAEQDFFDGTRFHRVEPNFVVQGGDPNSRPGSTTPAGSGGRGVWIPDESSRPDKRYHFAGSVAMAKSPDQARPGSTVANSGSSQFYVILEPAENLNAEYTVFGRVLDGIEVVESIRRNDDLLEVATISRPERTYAAETLPIPGIPPAGTTIPADPEGSPAETGDEDAPATTTDPE